MLGRNFLAGLFGSIWTAVLGLAVVPVYLRFLGEDAYGLVGFLATLQGLFVLLDLGLAQTINREVARCLASSEFERARNLLHTLATIYWLVAALIAALVACLSPIIASRWLHSENMSGQTLTVAVALMGAITAARWPVGVYAGALMGAEQLVAVSGINALMSTLGNAGAILILAFVSPTIHAFFVWQAAVGVLHALITRRAAWRALGDGASRFSSAELRNVWAFSQGVTGITLTALVLTQVDKVMLSRMLSLADFGRYTLAAVVARSLLLFIAPVFNVIYPRFSSLVQKGETVELTRGYRFGTNLLASVLFPIAMGICIAPQALIFFWTGNAALAHAIALTLSLVMIGTALNGVMYFPYALQLAYGATRLPLTINGILIVVLVPLTILLTREYGMAGGAAAGAILNALYLFLGIWMTHRSLLQGVGSAWILQDVGRPLALATLVGLVANHWQVDSIQRPWFSLACAGGLGTIALVAGVAISPHPLWTMLRASGWRTLIRSKS